MTFYVFQVLDVVIGRPGAWDATRLVYDHYTPCAQGNSSETYLLANQSKGHEYTTYLIKNATVQKRLHNNLQIANLRLFWR